MRAGVGILVRRVRTGGLLAALRAVPRSHAVSRDAPRRLTRSVREWLRDTVDGFLAHAWPGKTLMLLWAVAGVVLGYVACMFLAAAVLRAGHPVLLGAAGLAFGAATVRVAVALRQFGSFQPDPLASGWIVSLQLAVMAFVAVLIVPGWTLRIVCLSYGVAAAQAAVYFRRMVREVEG